jgi:hypothetical protein
MRKLNPEIALGFLVATVFWISVLIWQSYQATVPSEFFSAKLTDWLLAILTFFLVLFTYRLWRSTDKLWAAGEKQIAVARDSADAAKSAADAAKLNAQAVIDAERAFIFISVEKDNTDVIPRGATMDDEIAHGSTYTIPHLGVTYTVRNYGKSHALIKEMSHQIVVCPSFPAEPDYVIAQPMPIDVILGAGEKTDPIGCGADSVVTIAEAKAIKSSQQTVWFYGYVSYDDAFGFGREFRYKWHYNGDSGGLRLYSYKQIDTDKPH